MSRQTVIVDPKNAHLAVCLCTTRLFQEWRNRTLVGQVQSIPLEGWVGGKPKIVAKRDPSVSNSAWESIFQMNVDFHFTA